MNASELAMKMLEWEQAKLQLDALETEIKEVVLELGKTQTVGNVRASYSKGRKAYDYQLPIEKGISEGDIHPSAPQSYQIVKIDWRKMCKDFDLEAVVKGQSDPSVSIKLL